MDSQGRVFMKRVLIATILIGTSFCGATSEEFASITQEVSDDLIALAKEHPELQSRLYKVLDKLTRLPRMYSEQEDQLEQAEREPVVVVEQPAPDIVEKPVVSAEDVTTDADKLDDESVEQDSDDETL